MIRLLPGDCREVLATLPADSVQCCVCSPPYYGLRDYGTALWDGGDAACDHREVQAQNRPGRETPGGRGGSFPTTERGYRDTCGKCGATRIDRQIGLEATPDEYLATMVAVFREVRRVLRQDGTCWVNMGDSYASSMTSDRRMFQPMRDTDRSGGVATQRDPQIPRRCTTGNGLKPKDLQMMPARLALALQADGWWLRSDIIWHKPNPMPESCTDRPTSAHEHVFLLTRSSRYFYDADAVREEAVYGYKYGASAFISGAANGDGHRGGQSGPATRNPETGRSCRNVWTIATAPYSEAHFATFPPALAERCIKAGSRLGDTILDPFAGAGTTLLVADRLQRDAIGIELNPDYTTMAMERCRADAPLFAALPPAEPPEDERMADLFREAAD